MAANNIDFFKSLQDGDLLRNLQTMKRWELDIEPVESVKITDFELKYPVMTEFISAVRKKEEEVVLKVLKQLLKREPTIADAKKCSKIYEEGEPLNYHFAYEGIALGYMKFELTATTYTVTFTPSEHYR